MNSRGNCSTRRDTHRTETGEIQEPHDEVLERRVMHKIYSKVGLSLSVSLAAIGGTASVAAATPNQSTTTHSEIGQETNHSLVDATQSQCDDNGSAEGKKEGTSSLRISDGRSASRIASEVAPESPHRSKRSDEDAISTDDSKETVCAPTPVIPESPMTVLLPIAGVTTAFLTLQGRRRFARRNLIGQTR